MGLKAVTTGVRTSQGISGLGRQIVFNHFKTSITDYQGLGRQVVFNHFNLILRYLRAGLNHPIKIWFGYLVACNAFVFTKG